MKCIKGRIFSEVIRKKHNLEVYANYVQCELTPHWIGLTVVFGSPKRENIPRKSVCAHRLTKITYYKIGFLSRHAEINGNRKLIDCRHQLCNFTVSGEIWVFREVKKIIHRFCSSKGIFESVNISFIFTVFLLLPCTILRKWPRFNEKKTLFLLDFYVMWPLFRLPTIAQKSQQSASKVACVCLL